MIVWTPHALERAEERFPGEDLNLKYKSAKRLTRKQKKLILSKCPFNSKFMGHNFNGRYYRISQGRYVFVVEAISKEVETIVTVFEFKRVNDENLPTP